jgi:ATP-binding cassette subfamily B (MDR/TAP) protein 1
LDKFKPDYYSLSTMTASELKQPPHATAVPILKGFSVKIGHGQTLALVGASGSGKSTGIVLAERFYDPSSGSVTIDGLDIRKYNVNWLRDQIGLVNQVRVPQPSMFNQIFFFFVTFAVWGLNSLFF